MAKNRKGTRKMILTQCHKCWELKPANGESICDDCKKELEK